MSSSWPKAARKHSPATTRTGLRCKHTALADVLELAQSSLKTFTCNHSHGPTMQTHCPCRCARVGPKQPDNIHPQPLAWAHFMHHSTQTITSHWPTMQTHCLADELELAQSSLKTFTCNHSHGP